MTLFHDDRYARWWKQLEGRDEPESKQRASIHSYASQRAHMPGEIQRTKPNTQQPKTQLSFAKLMHTFIFLDNDVCHFKFLKMILYLRKRLWLDISSFVYINNISCCILFSMVISKQNCSTYCLFKCKIYAGSLDRNEYGRVLCYKCGLKCSHVTSSENFNSFSCVLRKWSKRSLMHRACYWT